MPTVVVIGAGLAGLRCVESLRRNGYTDRLLLVGAERHLPYNRTLLSKGVLASGVSHDAVAIPIRSAIGTVEWILGRRAVRVDTAAMAVSLDDGRYLPCDGIVIATGLRPRRLPVAAPGPTITAGRYVLRTLDDAIALRAALRPGQRVVIIGAGFVGCEVAATARALGCRVTVVSMDPIPLERPLGEQIGRAVLRRHRERGVEFRLGVAIADLSGIDKVDGVELVNGERIPADVVVEAVGSECNTDWLEGSGLETSDGVLTDGLMRACTPDGVPIDGVHAVGDVARFPNPLFDDLPRRVEHWNIPAETGKRAGAALAAHLSGEGYLSVEPSLFRPVPAFWSDQFDLRIQAYGMLGVGTRQRLIEGALDSEFIVGFYGGDDLLGVAGVGRSRQLHSYRAHLGAHDPYALRHG